MLYSYTAVDKTAQETKGEEEAENETELALHLRERGLLLLETTVPGEKGKGKSFAWLNKLPFFNRVGIVERMMFARNLAVMIGAGLAMTKSIEAARNQTANETFKLILDDILDSITKGKTFADSLRPHEKIFGALFIRMIAAAETSGKLESTLKILARQMKRDHDLSSKVRGAMIYPAIIFTVLIAIGILMMIFVIPTLTQTFNELGVELPFSTRVVIASSNFILNFYWVLLIGIPMMLYGAFRFLKTTTGKRIFDRTILRMPLFGPLIQKYNSARFSRTLGSLLSSGVSIIGSLEITSGVVSNALFQDAIKQASIEVEKGKQLNEILKQYPRIFPPLVTQMVEVGEETGTLSHMLFRLALFFEEDVTATTKNLSSVIEPVLMIIVGIVVGFFAVAMMQPIYNSVGNL
ncbi:type II secretion system F family protein [Patescibacteria group bacterium]|nr:type II secretion system F family protein [Patescibacteria group bacterium]